jgi:hypothetical protein
LSTDISFNDGRTVRDFGLLWRGSALWRRELGLHVIFRLCERLFEVRARNQFLPTVTFKKALGRRRFSVAYEVLQREFDERTLRSDEGMAVLHGRGSKEALMAAVLNLEKEGEGGEKVEEPRQCCNRLRNSLLLRNLYTNGTTFVSSGFCLVLFILCVLNGAVLSSA